MRARGGGAVRGPCHQTRIRRFRNVLKAKPNANLVARMEDLFMLSFLRHWLPGRAPARRHPAPRRRSVRPELFTLEDRLVPAAPVIGYDTSGLMHAFVLGLDNQVYEQDFDSAGRPASGY